MKKQIQFIREILKVLIISLIIAVVITLLLFVGGLLIGRNGTASGLETAKEGLLLIVSLGLFLLAGMLMIKGKKLETFSDGNKRSENNSTVDAQIKLALWCVVCLLIASLVDYLQL